MSHFIPRKCLAAILNEGCRNKSLFMFTFITAFPIFLKRNFYEKRYPEVTAALNHDHGEMYKLAIRAI
jgi:hypothetical protein